MELMRIQRLAFLAWICLHLLSMGQAGSDELYIMETESTSDISMQVGSTLSLHCVSTRGHSVVWYVHGIPLNEDDRHAVQEIPQVVAASLRVSRLEMRHLRLEDGGIISCREVERPDVRDQVTLRVTTKEHLQTVQIVQPQVRELLKSHREHLRLKCIGQGHDSLQWLHNDTVLQSGGGIVITNALTPNNHQAILMSRLSLREEHSGLYECRSERNHNDKDSIKLVVHNSRQSPASVTIVEPTSDQFVIISNQSLQIKCEAIDGTEIDWYKNNELIVRENNDYIIHNSNEYGKVSSFLYKKKIVEGATYKCQNRQNARDFDEILMQIAHTDTSEPQLQLPDDIEAVTMYLNQNLQLHCSIGASSGLYIATWRRDSSVIHPGPKYEISERRVTSTLTIKHAQREDAGIYTCSFNNSHSLLPAGSLHYNVTAIPCPVLKADPTYDVINCDNVKFVGEQCNITCLHGGHRDMPATQLLTCRYNLQTQEAYWPTSHTICHYIRENSHSGAIPSSTSNVTLQMNANIRLICGHRDVTWEHGGVVLQNSHKYHIERSGTLVIRKIDAKDVGSYRCSLRHHGGKIFGYKIFNLTGLACNPVEAPRHGYISDCAHPPLYGETCRFHCDEKHVLVEGSEYRTCGLNAEQSGATLTGHQPYCSVLSGEPGEIASEDSGSSNLYLTTSITIYVTIGWTLLLILS